MWWNQISDLIPIKKTEGKKDVEENSNIQKKGEKESLQDSLSQNEELHIGENIPIISEFLSLP